MPQLATFEGEFVSIEGNQLMLHVQAEEKMFQVAEDVTIMVDGKEGSLDDLKPGDRVTVEAEVAGDRMSAKSINATTVTE